MPLNWIFSAKLVLLDFLILQLEKLLLSPDKKRWTVNFSSKFRRRYDSQYSLRFYSVWHDPHCNINMSLTRSHKGTGGASPMIPSSKTGVYRKAKLSDLYDAARLIDRLKNVQFFRAMWLLVI